MRYFPSLVNTFDGTAILFHSEHCRKNYVLERPGVYTEERRERDDSHMNCGRCGQPLKITDIEARFIDKRGNEVAADVVNPGDKCGYGELYLVCVEDCYDPPLYVVEADDMSDAIEEFVSNDATAHMVEIEESSYGDYITQDETGEWVDLNGNPSDDDKSEAEFGPSGELYDDDNLKAEEIDAKGVRYFGVYEDVALPEKGILANRFSKWVDFINRKNV
jgi:hypothetical protein